MRAAVIFVIAAWLAALPGFAQESNTIAQQPIAYVPLDGVKVSGALDVSNGRATIGASGTITAGDGTASVALVRGGELRLCATTTVHLATDHSASTTGSPALLIALDRGALEASYTPGKYSDVILTPDFRILVSGPGTADLKLRVSAKGDTCIDNHGASSPYVTVSSQFDNGVYRVQPNQRVLFEHGSLHDVVDNESEPCGCPPAPQTSATAQLGVAITPPASPSPNSPATPTPGAIAAPAKPAESKPAAAGTEFPLAVSEGLAPPPAPPTAPVAAPGEVHVQVTVPLAYEGTTGKSTSAAAGGTNIPPVPDVATTPAPTPAVAPAPAAASPPPGNTKPQSKPGFFHSIGHFFSRLFGGG